MPQILSSRSLTSNTYVSFSQKKFIGTKAKRADVTLTECLQKLLTQKIAQGIDSFLRAMTNEERELFKYLAYYHKKFGVIKIGINNMLDRFKLNARSWLQELLAKLYDYGLLYTVKSGGGKVTQRAFTERGKMVWKAITQGFKLHKQDIPICTGHSTGHSLPPYTKYISSEVDKLKDFDLEEEEINQEKCDIETGNKYLSAIKDLLKVRKNE